MNAENTPDQSHVSQGTDRCLLQWFMVVSQIYNSLKLRGFCIELSSIHNDFCLIVFICGKLSINSFAWSGRKCGKRKLSETSL